MNLRTLPAIPLLSTLLLAPFLAAASGGRPSDVPCDGLTSHLATLPVEPLPVVEEDGLLLTREEEKLARDVCVAMAATRGHRVFTTIAAAERRHTDAVPFLLERYGLADPAEGLAPGVFANERLQALYASLVEKGRLSLVDALAAGATIEDLDRADVGDLLEEAGDVDVDVDTLKQNLAKGSRNHLRSFVSPLTAAGATDEPPTSTPGRTRRSSRRHSNGASSATPRGSPWRSSPLVRATAGCPCPDRARPAAGQL